MNETCHTSQWSMSHVNESCHIRISHFTYKWVCHAWNEPHHTWMRHAAYGIAMPHMNEPHHIWMSLITYEGDMPQIWMSEAVVYCHMRWLQWLLGSLNWQVSCAKEPFKNRTLLRKTLVYFVVLYTSSTQWSSTFLRRVLFMQAPLQKGLAKIGPFSKKRVFPFCCVLQPLHNKPPCKSVFVYS